MYMDDIKLFAKNEKELETLIHAVRIYSQDIGMEFGIGKCLCSSWKVANNIWLMEWNNQITTEFRTLEEKETYKYLGI